MAKSKRGAPSTCSAGEENFVALFAGVAPALYAWAHVRILPPLRRRMDPDDVVQEVCYRAFRALSTFDPARATFRTWTFSIAHNVLRELLRRQPMPGESALGSMEKGTAHGFAAIADEATSVTTKMVSEEHFQGFLERLSELEDNDRRLLLYRGMEGLSHEETAVALGMTVEMVQKRWQRLRARLRDAGLPAGLIAK